MTHVALAGGSLILRPAMSDDEPFLWEMLREAALRLYTRAAFVVVGREGDTFTMRLDLAATRS